jgi:hypothetical protein
MEKEKEVPANDQDKESNPIQPQKETENNELTGDVRTGGGTTGGGD